jgi:glycine/D-amino acid oxidase-like deaminating enzyme
MTSSRRDLAGLGPPRSLWEATAEPGPALPRLEGEARADVAVVGGGIAGLSTALHLAEQGVDVVLLEGETIGHGASGRNGGQVIPGLKHDPDDLIATFGRDAAEPMIDFAGRTADVLFALVDRHRIDCDAVRHGWIQAAHDDAAVRLVQERARQWGERGAPVAALDAAGIADHSGARGYRGGWIDRRAGRLQPLAYTRGLARAAAAAGARLLERSRVERIARSGGRWQLATAAGRLAAERLVLCMNAYANRAWRGLAESYIPVATYQIATAPLPEPERGRLLRDDIAVSDTHPLLRYFRKDAAGRLVMGGPGSLRPLAQGPQVAHLVLYVERLFPALAGRCRPEFYWGGDVAVTLDHLPHLHDLGDGAFAFLGCNGRGVALATAMGVQLARLAAGAEPRDIPFRFSPLAAVPLHAAYPLYIQAATAWYQLRESLRQAG